MHLLRRVRLEDVDRHRPLLGLAEHRCLLAVFGLQRHDDVRVVDVPRDDDRQLQLAHRLLEALAADALRQHPERRQRPGPLDVEDRTGRLLAIPGSRGLGPVGPPEIGLGLDVVRVDRPGPLLGLERVEGACRLLPPGTLPIALPCVACPLVGSDTRGEPLERPTVRDVAGDEGPLVGPDGQAARAAQPEAGARVWSCARRSFIIRAVDRAT